MTTPYIIFSKKNCRAIRSCIVENYGLVRYEFPFINALSVEVPEDKIDNIKRHKRVAMVARDGSVSKLPLCSDESSAVRGSSGFTSGLILSPAEAARLIGAQTFSSNSILSQNSSAGKLNFMENKGFGTTIAIIDTGIAPHYDLVKPYNRIIVFKDLLNNRHLPYDDDGHGTHVAGIAAGNGYTLGYEGFPGGIAPLAKIAAVKALDERGNGSVSDILAAMQWVAENQERYNIKIVNLSLGISVEPSESIDPLAAGAAALVARGLTVVTAAGNSGPGPCTITSPGISPFVITAGSCDGKLIPDFSSRGPTISGGHKPDLVAPGVDIVSLDAKTCKNYVLQSGTSMSCPYVSGVIACLYSQRPDLTPRQVRSLLYRMLFSLPSYSRDSQGRGALYV